MSKYPTHQVILIRPVRFGFNPQTAESNAFQNPACKELPPEERQARALREFSAVTETLTEADLDVLIFDDTPEPYTPDSIFPNNWFSTHPDGTLCLYPMLAENRRDERRSEIVATLQNKFDVSQTIDLSAFENDGKFLEGTGSLVLDHKNRMAYACLSERTNEELLKLWAKKMDFEIIFFSASNSEGAIYHTNVLMCVGDDFAIVCLESAKDIGEREKLRDSLTGTGKKIIEISLRQMDNFAGNMLLLSNKAGKNILIMSQSAHDSLDPEQVEALSEYARLISVKIPTIELCGGGSVRCMIAENFLNPK
jgi:hypothetical protein